MNEFMIQVRLINASNEETQKWYILQTSKTEKVPQLN